MSVQVEVSETVAPAPADAIPIIDIGPYPAGEPGAIDRIAEEIHRACTEIGFFFIVNHGMDERIVDRAFDASRDFFALSIGRKDEGADEPPSVRLHAAQRVGPHRYLRDAARGDARASQRSLQVHLRSRSPTIPTTARTGGSAVTTNGPIRAPSPACMTHLWRFTSPSRRWGVSYSRRCRCRSTCPLIFSIRFSNARAR